jgi:hypothetical protein
LNLSFDHFDKSKNKHLFARYSNPDNSGYSKDADKLLLDIFNNNFKNLPAHVLEKLKEIKEIVGNDIENHKCNLSGDYMKTLMITRSGSEGISLKNVRSVHILEPYWNNIRLEQVIGRANRTNSHKDLPLNSRNFRAYNYLTIFSNQQKKDMSQIIKKVDKLLSTDETIKAIADKKSKLISGFLQNLKNASIDCALHKKGHKNINCLNFVTSDELQNAYTFNISDEYVDKVISPDMINNLFTQIISFNKIDKYQGKSFIYVPENETLFDHDLYLKTGDLKIVGTMKKIDESGVKYNVKVISEKK